MHISRVSIFLPFDIQKAVKLYHSIFDSDDGNDLAGLVS
jgi:hypothetical protein